jgi:hypothetical protein
VGIHFIHPERLNLGHVGVHRNVIFGEVIVDKPAEARVHDGILVQGEPDAPDHAADKLAARGARVDDAAGPERADHAGDAHLAERRVDANLGELRSEDVHRILLLFTAGFRSRFHLDEILA